MRKLLIFGLKGVLTDATHASVVAADASLPSQVVGSRRIWLRPHAAEFLAEVATEFDLAVWSTANRRNTAAMVGMLPNVPWKFIWTREHADNDDYRRIHAVDNEDTWATQRSVAPLVRSLGIPRRRLIFVDDSASKCRMDADRLIVIPTFEATMLNATADQALKDLRAALTTSDELMLPAFL